MTAPRPISILLAAFVLAHCSSNGAAPTPDELEVIAMCTGKKSMFTPKEEKLLKLADASSDPAMQVTADAIRARSLHIFDRSFAVTYWLQAVAIVIGLFGVMLRRNVLIVLMSIELMLNSVNLTLVAYNRLRPINHNGQILAFFVIAVAAAEAALGLAIVLVYMILAAQFDSFIQPIVIMISLPLSVIGAFGGIYLAGMTLNIFSFIGLIMLMGLVTKTAILLVDFTNGERAHGSTVTEALAKAGQVRLRPIIMTALATIFGMVPVALALGEGGEARAPMAVIVIGGMITSTILTLVVVPVSYLLFDRLVTSRSMKWIGSTFLGIDPNAPPESLDDPIPVGGYGHAQPGAHALHAAPASADPSASDTEFTIDTDIVIPTIVKPGHRE